VKLDAHRSAMHVRPVAFTAPPGFFDVGTIDGAGIKTKANPGGDVPVWAGRTVRTLQNHATVRLRFDVEYLSAEAVAIMFGPLAGAAWAFRNVNPHWYLEGES
jgi:hypothetical protein